MGRRPNQLILEFFNRGPKLEDASNRYQHTCKACGERFPKGRIDSLTNHLVKKCTALPVAMRQSVLLRLHELPELPAGSNADKAKTGNTTDKGKNVELGFAPRPGFNGLNGLNVLAEASRQVGASETKGKSKQGQQQRQQQQQLEQQLQLQQQQEDQRFHDSMVLDPALEAENFHALIQHSGQSPQQSYSPPQNTAPSLPSFPHDAKPTSPQAYFAAQSQPAAAGQMPISTEPSDLSMIAASANEIVPHGLDGANKIDQPGDDIAQRTPWQGSNGLSEDMALIEHLADQEGSANTDAQRAVSYPRPIAMNTTTQNVRAFANNFSDAAPSPKPKVRGRFTDSRRREVQDVRKKGACIRCRMLKKPCSGETPCYTCKNVDSARLWKQPCIRTRIADEFTLWQAGLHGTLAFVDINSIKNRLKFEHQTGCIEVTHADDADETCTMISFAALEVHGQTAGQLDPQLSLGPDGSLQGVASGPRILDGDADDLVGKLEMYMREMAPTFIERELSGFWKTTLGTALKLSAGKPDNLLARTIELWVATQILVDPDMGWKMFSNPSQPPSPHPTTSTTSLPNLVGSYGRHQIDHFTDSESFTLIQAQLRSAAEKRSSVISKTIMNDLERRLLQRQQSGAFETFLVALILLNCVERTCWLFKTWEVAGLDVRPWPLDTKPAEYGERGERFSEILFMLLKIRAIPPRTTVRPDTNVLIPAEAKDERVDRWFEDIQLPLQTLQQRANSQFDASNPRSYDLRFGSQLLQPVSVWAGS